jgi:hypothetical protein
MDDARERFDDATAGALRAAMRRCGLAAFADNASRECMLALSPATAAGLVDEVDAAAGDPALQRAILSTVNANAARLPALLSLLAGAGFAEAVLRAMATHSDDARLILEAHAALTCVLEKDELPADVFARIARDAVRHLTALNDDTSDYASLLPGSAALLLCNMAADAARPWSQAAVRAAGALHPLSAVLSAGRHLAHEHTAVFCVQALADISAHADTPLADAQVALHGLLAAMLRFPEDTQLHETAAKAMRGIFARHQPLRVHALRAGVLAPLIAALARQAHADADAAFHAAVTLRHVQLLLFAAPPDTLVDAWAAVAAVLRAHVAHEAACIVCMDLLALSVSSADHVVAAAPRFVRTGALDAALDAMRTHARVPTIQHGGCVMLLHLVFHHPPSGGAAVAAGAIHAVTQALHCANQVAAGRGTLLGAAATAAEASSPQAPSIHCLQRLIIRNSTNAVGVELTRTMQHRALRALHAGALAELHAVKACPEPAATHRADLIDCLQRFAHQHAADGAPCATCDALRAAGGMCSLAGCLACAATDGDAERPGRLKVCSRCKRAAYCCKEHQLRAWREHKKQCVAAEQQAGGAADAHVSR